MYMIGERESVAIIMHVRITLNSGQPKGHNNCLGMDKSGGRVSRGLPFSSPLAPSLGLRHLAVAAAASEQKKTGKKHPGKAILAGEQHIQCTYSSESGD